MTVSPIQIPCLICGEPLKIKPSQGRKSGKPSLMLVCSRDGRHFRGFINDQNYVNKVLSRLEGHTPSLTQGDDVDGNLASRNGSKTILERPAE